MEPIFLVPLIRGSILFGFASWKPIYFRKRFVKALWKRKVLFLLRYNNNNNGLCSNRIAHLVVEFRGCPCLIRCHLSKTAQSTVQKLFHLDGPISNGRPPSGELTCVYGLDFKKIILKSGRKVENDSASSNHPHVLCLMQQLLLVCYYLPTCKVQKLFRTAKKHYDLFWWSILEQRYADLDIFFCPP